MCQFGHFEPHLDMVKEGVIDEDIEEPTDNLVDCENDEQDEIEDIVSESESVCYGKNDCHLCDKTFTCLDELCEHFRREHTEYQESIQREVADHYSNQNLN